MNPDDVWLNGFTSGIGFGVSLGVIVCVILAVIVGKPVKVVSTGVQR